MIGARVRVDDREVRASLKALRVEGPKAVADALNRTGFEVLDAEEREVRGAFDFAGPSTERFLSRGFAFDKATPGRLAVTVYGRRGARNILEHQALGAFLGIGEPDVGPGLEGQVAVPLDTVKRTSRGKVRATQLPARVVGPGGRGFVSRSGRAVLQRVRGGGVRVLYALVSRVRIPKRFDFFGTVAQTARREFPKKADRVLEKINLRRRGA